MKTVNRIAAIISTIRNIESGKVSPLMGSEEALMLHDDRLETLMADAPRGSGFDNGTTLDDASHAQRLVFNTSFHHMDEAGGYAGWSDHQIIVTPRLDRGFDVQVTGRDRNGIKEYIGDVFHWWLTQESTTEA